MHSVIPAWHKYLGRAWAPDFDCWALVRAVYADELNIDLPFTGIAPDTLRKSLRLIAKHPIRSKFEQVDAPEHLAVAEFSSPDAHPFHIGLYVVTPDGPMILHNPKCGVVLEPRLPENIKFWIYRG